MLKIRYITFIVSLFIGLSPGYSSIYNSQQDAINTHNCHTNSHECCLNSENNHHHKSPCDHGNCNQSCDCPHTISPVIHSFFKYKAENTFSHNKRHMYPSYTVILTHGFFKIWVPPKIS